MFCIVTRGDCLEVPQIFETPGDTLYMYLRYVLYDMSINSNDDSMVIGISVLYKVIILIMVYRFFIISLFVCLFRGDISYRYLYIRIIKVLLGFVILCTLFCLLGGIGRCSHCV